MTDHNNATTSAPASGRTFGTTSRATSNNLPALVVLLVMAVAVGGGGSHYGITNGLVLLAALGALSFHREAFFDFWRATPVALRVLIAASLVLPLVQIVPLPPAMWTEIPGRDLVARSFQLAGWRPVETWAPLSVQPARTALALSALIVPLSVITIGWSVRRDHLATAGWALVAMGLVQFALGSVQVLSNGETGLLYPENPMPGVLFGLFANRNSTGLFLVGALALAAFLPMPRRAANSEAALRGLVMVMLVLAIVLTRSRTALVLTFLPLGLFALQFFTARSSSDRGQPSNPRRGIFAAGVAALALAALAVSVSSAPGRVSETVERFDMKGTDARAYIWPDAVYSASRYWPAGAGIGTFDDVFQVDEALENMALRRPGRAHNDYLEIAIEAGLAGVGLVVGWLGLIAWLCWRARQSSGRWQAWAGGTILLTIALQSITDYPLRNLSMLALAGYALIVLVKFSRNPSQRKSRS